MLWPAEMYPLRRFDQPPSSRQMINRLLYMKSLNKCSSCPKIRRDHKQNITATVAKNNTFEHRRHKLEDKTAENICAATGTDREATSSSKNQPYALQ